jgi:rhodanese-related sulfurtransferase
VVSGENGSMALLRRARAGLDRLSPTAALAEQQGGAVLVDLRTETHRADAPGIPGALVIDLTVLPWRLDPGFEYRIPEATSWDARYVLFCRHGYASSLAAWNLRQSGLHRATDIIGGFEGWQRDGLPIDHGDFDVRP